MEQFIQKIWFFLAKNPEYLARFTTGVMARPEIKYTRQESKRGFTLDIIGFAIVETEPKSIAPIIADI